MEANYYNRLMDALVKFVEDYAKTATTPEEVEALAAVAKVAADLA